MKTERVSGNLRRRMILPAPCSRAYLLAKALRALGVILLLFGVVRAPVGRAAPPAQEITPTPAAAPTPVETLPGVPVTVGGKTIFYLGSGSGEMSAAERAADISKRIEKLATNPFVPPYEITVTESREATSIFVDDQLLLTISEADAQANGLSPDQAGQSIGATIGDTVTQTRAQRSVPELAGHAFQSLLILGIIILLLWLINWVYRRTVRWVEERPTTWTRFRRFTSTNYYKSGRWKRPVKAGLNLVRWALAIAVLLIGIPILLHGFASTRELADQVLYLVFKPLAMFWDWLVNYTDEFVIILLIAGGAYILIRLVRWFFGEIERGGLRFKGADPTQARFTAGIISTLITVGAAIMIFPYLPGADSPAFRAVMVFIGALITFASTSAIANTVSGILLVYTDAFTIGDIVQVGQVQGKVTEQHVLTTVLRTVRNEMISIPNSVVLNGYIINYSRLGSDDGLVLFTTVTIGYDAPWKQVHELLIAAARATPDVLEKPAPFVLQTALNDYNVSYELNCLTRRPGRLLITQSNLHENIQDKFNEAGIELLSPAYSALRDGNTSTIPEASRPAGYQPSGFRIFK